METNTIEVERAPDGTIELTPGQPTEPTTAGGLNVGNMERWASLAGGGALIARGLMKGGTRGIATAVIGGVLAQRGATGHCPVYGALGMNTASDEDGRTGLAGLSGLPGLSGLSSLTGSLGLGGGTAAVEVRSVATVGRPADELYRFWRDPLNLPRFMTSLESVRPLDDRRAEWTLKPPVGPTIEFVAEITADEPGRRIAWRSEESAVVKHTGEVRFEEMPHDRGTAVRLTLDFSPPAGPIGAGIVKLFDGAMETQLRKDLKNFKMLIETGEIATIDGQPTGPGQD